jgi:hypothetical protein
VTCFTVFSFCSRRSKTVRSVAFFFGTHSIGTAWCATAGTHHSAVVYHSIFADRSSRKCSGLLGSLYLIRFVGSTKLISWLTSRNGGSSSGIPLTRLSILSIHSSRRRGMSLCVRITRCDAIRRRSLRLGPAAHGISFSSQALSSQDESDAPYDCRETVRMSRQSTCPPGFN